VEYIPDTIVLALNGIYTGVMLVLNGGLGALASGDFEAVQEVYSQIDPLFTDQNENLALLLVIFSAVAIGLILAAVMKSKPAVFGMIWGLAYGYLVSAAVLPLISSNPATTIPVPLLRPNEREAGAAAAEASSGLNQLFATLAEPENVEIIASVIGIFIIVLLLLTVRSGVKSGKKKKAGSNGAS